MNDYITRNIRRPRRSTSEMLPDRLKHAWRSLQMALSLCAFAAFCAVPGAAHAQDLPAGVALGMSADELKQILPGLEKVRRPKRMAGGLVGSWSSPETQLLGLSGQQTFYFADGRLGRVEFVGTAPNAAENLEAFNSIVTWGRNEYGPALMSNDGGTTYAVWNAEDAEVYAQYGAALGAVRLVFKRRPERDGSQL